MRHTTVVTAALVVLATAVVPAAAGDTPDGGVAHPEASTATAADVQSANDTENATPGAQLGGVAGVQGAELEGELSQRAFVARVANAGSNDSAARVVGETHGHLEARLAELRDRRERLREARENGSLGQGQFTARMAVLAAESEALRRVADRVERASRELPADVRREHGVNVDAIGALEADAANVTDSVDAGVAVSLTGPDGQNDSAESVSLPENGTDAVDSDTADTDTIDSGTVDAGTVDTDTADIDVADNDTETADDGIDDSLSERRDETAV